ncbi:ras-related protein RABG2-like [Raphanus sativus]|uniref:Ras-related protein RABG2-like n=1 Tax=Raphanus sativus TaxID=3726 RepID=A0A9W3BY80_RAPSA|nr:ras-related protein RABG2-like [Raphanus sativus]
MESLKNRTLLKVIVLGDSGVGKTSLMNQYVYKKFNRQYKATIGADFVTKELHIEDKSVTLQRDEPLSIEVLIVVFLSTMSTISNLLKLSILGTLSSLNRWRKQPSYKRAIEWCGSKENIPYYETSAKEDVNVDEAFLGVAHKTLSSDLKQNIYIPVISEYFADIHEEQSRGCSC